MKENILQAGPPRIIPKTNYLERSLSLRGSCRGIGREMVGKLERYYREVPKETACLGKDPKALQAVVEITCLRVDLIRKLKAALKQ